MKVIMPLDWLIVPGSEGLVQEVRHVAGDGDAEHQGDAHPEWAVQVGPRPHVVLQEGLARQRHHRVQHAVLHVRCVHVKELLVEGKSPEVGGFPVRGSAAAALGLVIDQLTGVAVRGRGRELGQPGVLPGAPASTLNVSLDYLHGILIWPLMRWERSAKIC